MRMWRIKILYIFLCLIITACATPQFKLDEEARTKLSGMPGRIEVKVSGSDKYWHYNIVNGELLLQSIEDYRPGQLEQHPYITFPKEAPKAMPNIRDFEYHGPYRLSPDNSLMFLSIAPISGAYVPMDFVLDQIVIKEVIFQRKSNKKYLVRDIAWSPDSNMFAVLDVSSKISHGILGLISFIFGHPVDVCKFYLSIYDRKGNLLVKTKVASGVLSGSGRVSWEK